MDTNIGCVVLNINGVITEFIVYDELYTDLCFTFFPGGLPRDHVSFAAHLAIVLTSQVK